jgi:hypothetical protein
VKLLTYEQQMKRNLALSRRFVAQLLRSPDQEAARRIFSVLAHLEEIAVLAAERGDGIEGQLDDEKAHRDTFAWVAKRLGGLEPKPGSIHRLHEYLTSLRGPASLAVLNVVAEAWLENVFVSVAPWGPWKALLETIGEEEARHSQEALRSARVEPSEALLLVRVLEDHLFEISVDPEFLWPLARVGGIPAVAAMGQQSLEKHRAAVMALGVEPGPASEAIAACGREGLADVAPQPVLATASQRAMIHGRVPPIGAHLSIPWSGSRDPATVEARVVQAVAHALRDVERVNRTITPDGELWAPVDPTVGVRRLWGPERDHIMTVYARSPDAQPTAEVEGRLAQQALAAQARPYIGTPPLGDSLLQLAPPSRAAATVTCVTPFFPAGSRGESRLSPLEGSTWSVCATSFERRGMFRRHHLWLWVEADHRVHDGRRLGAFLASINDALS